MADKCNNHNGAFWCIYLSPFSPRTLTVYYSPGSGNGFGLMGALLALRHLGQGLGAVDDYGPGTGAEEDPGGNRF